MKSKALNFEGIVFDLETQSMRQEDSFPLMSIAVTWDKKKGFCAWKEKDVNELVKYISEFPYIIGANLMGFDYQVLENYVPSVRSKLGRKTIDILTHARWGHVLKEIEEIFSMLDSMFGGYLESKDEKNNYARILKGKISFFGLTLDKSLSFVPDIKHDFGFQYEVGISLGNLAVGTLQKKKLGKSASAPKLFQSDKYKELIRYCKQDVLLTRNIFNYGFAKDL